MRAHRWWIASLVLSACGGTPDAMDGGRADASHPHSDGQIATDSGSTNDSGEDGGVAMMMRDAGGAAVRPAYNTGTGFFVLDGTLYDANGIAFRIRGVNKLHWDADSPGIPRTHANTERWVIDFGQSADTNLGLIQQSIDNHIVPMPGNWDGTCDESSDTLHGIVDTWVSQASTWQMVDSMILNIANEWGPSGTGWRDAYIDEIARLRAAGYTCTISVTSGGCGQDNDDLAMYAQDVFDSDPQRNVIFDQHIYGIWSNGGGESWQTDLDTGLDRLASTGLVFIVGEFGPGRSIGPSPTDMTPSDIIEAAESRGFGWLAWAWDDPASGADDTSFALSRNGDYRSSDDLTMFGQEVVEDPNHGLVALAQPASIF